MKQPTDRPRPSDKEKLLERLRHEGEIGRFNFSLPVRLYREFKAKCQKEGVTMSGVVVKLIEWFLEKR